jgi:hypothetical protein
MRTNLLATGVVDARIVGTEIHSLIDWTCLNKVCAKKKTYTESPAARLARRAQQ